MVSSKNLCTFAPAFGDNDRVQSNLGSGFSAVGSAHVWGARGRWFESSNPDTKSERIERFPRFFVLIMLVVVYQEVEVLAIYWDIEDDILGLHFFDADKTFVL